MTTQSRVWERSMAAVLSTAIVFFWFYFALRWQQTGWDFPVFYIAGSLPRAALYSREAFAHFWQEHLANLGVLHWARFVRLPFFSFVLRPLAALPYREAFGLWIVAGVASYLTALGLLKRGSGLPWLAIPAFLAFYPAVAGLVSGQDNCLMLLGITLGWVMLEEKRDYLAGGIFVLGLLKFNLLVLVPIVLLFHRRVRALSVFSAGAILLAGASFLITPLSEYLSALREVPSETAGFFPFGLRGLSLVLGQNWIYPVLAVLVVLFCCWLILRLPLSDGFCVAITGTLLVVPYVCWYDSTLLVLPLARMIAMGSPRVRAACVVLLLLGSGWRYLFAHLFAEFLILAYFAHLANKPKTVINLPVMA